MLHIFIYVIKILYLYKLNFVKVFKLLSSEKHAESTGVEPDPGINRTHCLAGNRYHRQTLLSNKINRNNGWYVGFEPT